MLFLTKDYKVVFITERVTEGSLRAFCEKVSGLRLIVVRRWAEQILDGLKYLHSQEPACRGRWYGGRCLMPKLVPVPNFSEGRCRKFDINSCDRGGACNFLHVKKLGESFGRDFLLL